MSEQRSVLLRSEFATTNVKPPSATRARRSVLKLFRTWILWVTLTLIATYAVLQLFDTRWKFVVVACFVFAAGVAMYRDYFRWWHNHDKMNPDNAVLYVEDHAHPFIMLGINGSADNPFPFEHVEVDTPEVNLIERIFRCGKMVIGDTVLKDVKRKNINAFLAIQQYRESLDKQSIVLDKQQVDVQMATLETLESMGEDLHNLVGLVSTLTQHVLRLTASMPQQAPTLSRTSVPTRQPVVDDGDMSPDDTPQTDPS